MKQLYPVVYLPLIFLRVQCQSESWFNNSKEKSAMDSIAISRFEIKSWEEIPFSQTENGLKLTRASVTKSFQGDIEGDGRLEYLMTYFNDSTATFIGLEHVVGNLGTRSGSFVLKHSGIFENGTAKATCKIVSGSGTGDLKGLEGEGSYEATDREATVTVNYYYK